MISYEYPLNERIRTLLRLEDLFLKIAHFTAGGAPQDHHVALLTIFETLEVAGRADLKVDLVQELERQRQILMSFRNNPEISEEALAGALYEIEQASTGLLAMAGKIGQYLRENEWLMSIRSRAAIPGGVCQFDLPSYHYWLGLSSERRRQDINTWINPLMPLYDAIRIILHILRGSGATTSMPATKGSDQQLLGGAKPAQMLRVEISDEIACFPEVSANKYAINIRFNSLDNAQRPRPCDHDINFSLTLCNL